MFKIIPEETLKSWEQSRVAETTSLGSSLLHPFLLGPRCPHRCCYRKVAGGRSRIKLLRPVTAMTSASQQAGCDPSPSVPLSAKRSL